jgi:hypothetical protein
MKKTGYPRGYSVEKKLKQGIFADKIKLEYFLTGENDWHDEDITHLVIEKNPKIKTITCSDSKMLISPNVPLKSDDEYLREPDCATFALRTIVNGRIIWENTNLGQLLEMYKNDGDYRPFICGCGCYGCAGLFDDIKTVHTDQHVILYMGKYGFKKCGPDCYKFSNCRKRNGRCSAFRNNVIREFKFDKDAFKQQIFAVISSRIAIENIHKVWETPEDDPQALSDQELVERITSFFRKIEPDREVPVIDVKAIRKSEADIKIGNKLTRLFCTDSSNGQYQVRISKEIRQLRQEMIMEAIQYHKDHYHPEEQEPKQ